MRPNRSNPRSDYREEENRRANKSPSLAEKYKDLKSLTLKFAYFSPEGVSKNRRIKYTVNPEHARSVFRLDCFNTECVGGDFDLSEMISTAVATHQTKVTGEMSCEGWLSKTTIDRVHCHTLLRYEISLAYEKRETKSVEQLRSN